MSTEIRFDQPIHLGGADGVVIRDAAEASAMLRTSWPETRGKWYHAANRACSSAIEGRTPAHVARGMFLKASEESRLLD